VLAQRATVAYDAVVSTSQSPTSEPVAVAGIPLYNSRQHVEEALGSLAGQRRPLRLVVVDDCSTDGSGELAERWAAAEGVPFERRGVRLGLVGAWRRALELALISYPDARYFAWGSDHDVWHPDWLGELIAALEANPGNVLAYPLAEAISDDGSRHKRGERRFQTAGVIDPLERLRLANGEMHAGDMIYGLYRVDALLRCGPFPATLLPDRLLLARLALEGEFVQVERKLWSRRYREGVRSSLRRQRFSLFGKARPRSAYLPWWIPHAIWFFRSLQGSPTDRARLVGLYTRTAYSGVRTKRRESAARRRRRRKKNLRRWLAGHRASVRATLARFQRRKLRS
jgi:glycosyltransferase involved in cell wall biosynthesis